MVLIGFSTDGSALIFIESDGFKGLVDTFLGSDD